MGGGLGGVDLPPFIVTIIMIEPEGIMGFFDHPHNPTKAIKIYVNRLHRILANLFGDT